MTKIHVVRLVGRPQRSEVGFSHVLTVYLALGTPLVKWLALKPSTTAAVLKTTGGGSFL